MSRVCFVSVYTSHCRESYPGDVFVHSTAAGLAAGLLCISYTQPVWHRSYISSTHRVMHEYFYTKFHTFWRLLFQFEAAIHTINQHQSQGLFPLQVQGTLTTLQSEPFSALFPPPCKLRVGCKCWITFKRVSPGSPVMWRMCPQTTGWLIFLKNLAKASILKTVSPQPFWAKPSAWSGEGWWMCATYQTLTFLDVPTLQLYFKS